MENVSELSVENCIKKTHNNTGCGVVVDFYIQTVFIYEDFPKNNQ